MEETLNDFSFDQDLEIEDMDRFHGNDIFDNEVPNDGNTQEEQQSSPDGEPVQQPVAEEQQEEKPKRGRPKKEEEVPVDMEMPEDSDESSDESYYTDLYNNFREIGIIGADYNIEKGKNLTNDELLQILNSEKEAAAEQMFKEKYLNRIMDDDDAKQFIEFKLKGGSTREFFNVYGKNSGFDFNGDLDDEHYQDTVIKKYLRERDGLTDDEIEEQLEMLETSGKKGKYAQKYHETMLREDQKEKSLLEQRRIQEAEQQKKVIEQRNMKFAQAINATDNVFGARLTKERKANIYGMLTSNVRKPDGNVVSAFNYFLDEAVRNPNKLVILTDLLLNDFDMSKYSDGVRTQVTKEIRRNLNFNRTSSRSKPVSEQKGEDWFN